MAGGFVILLGFILYFKPILLMWLAVVSSEPY
jgi:hypothetical protein